MVLPSSAVGIITVMDCKEEACVRRCREMREGMGRTDEEDFLPFHCSVEGCHDISLGKTSHQCLLCEDWVCQGCSPTEMKEWDGELVCLGCYAEEEGEG